MDDDSELSPQDMIEIVGALGDGATAVKFLKSDGTLTVFTIEYPEDGNGYSVITRTFVSVDDYERERKVRALVRKKLGISSQMSVPVPGGWRPTAMNGQLVLVRHSVDDHGVENGVLEVTDERGRVVGTATITRRFEESETYSSDESDQIELFDDGEIWFPFEEDDEAEPEEDDSDDPDD